MAKTAQRFNGNARWIPLVVILIAACVGYGGLTSTVVRNKADISIQAKTLNRIDRIVSRIAGELGVSTEEERD